jgi:hypothetical protein
MARNSTLPDAGGEFSSSMDCRTTLLPLAPVAENPVAITVYCNPALQLTVSLKTEVVEAGPSTSETSLILQKAVWREQEGF